MKKLILILVLVFNSCSDSTSNPAARDFNLKFAYGVNAQNVLNTFEHTYTKDLIIDGTVTVQFRLSDNELEQIHEKMNEIGFFNYPDTFVVPTGDTVVTVTPYATYDFEVTYQSSNKSLYWKNDIMNPNAQATKLRELITFIRTLIESKPEYLQLPPANGGYL